MSHRPDSRAPAGPSPSEAAALLSSARNLQRAARAGATQPLLRGKNFGLLCETDGGDAELFTRAAVELGAHVAQLRPSLSELSTAQDVQHTASMLGRLYDAVECQGMAGTLVRQVGKSAGVPVFEGLASAAHPTAALAAQLDGDVAAREKRRYVVQAVLLAMLG